VFIRNKNVMILIVMVQFALERMESIILLMINIFYIYILLYLCDSDLNCDNEIQFYKCLCVIFLKLQFSINIFCVVTYLVI